MSEVIKIQRPVSQNGLSGPWLLYDKGGSHLEQRADAFLNEDVKAAMGGAPTGYFQAEWTAEGWKIGDKVLDQGW